MNYAIRVSYGYDNTLEGFAEYLQTPGVCDRYAIYEHVADVQVNRTHIHALVMGLTVTTDTLKNKITDCLKVRPKGNKEWSFKTKYKPYKTAIPVDVDDKYIIYMSKGKLDSKSYKGYTEEQILEYKKAYVPMGNEAKIDIVDGHFVVNDNEQKSLTKRQMLSLMIAKYDKISNQGIRCPDILCKRTMEMIGNVLRAQGEPIGENKVLDYYDSVLMHCEQSKWLDNVCHRIRQRYR